MLPSHRITGPVALAVFALCAQVALAEGPLADEWLGRLVSLHPVSHPEWFVRHCGGLGFIDKNDKSNPACDPNAFAQDVIDRIKVPDLRDQLETFLFEKFHEQAK